MTVTCVKENSRTTDPKTSSHMGAGEYRKTRKSKRVSMYRVRLEHALRSNLVRILSEGGVFGSNEVEKIVAILVRQLLDSGRIDGTAVFQSLRQSSFSKDEAKELARIFGEPAK